MPYSRYGGGFHNINPYALLLVLLEMMSRHMAFTAYTSSVMQSVRHQWMLCMSEISMGVSDADVELEDVVWRCVVDGANRLKRLRPRIYSHIVQQVPGMLFCTLSCNYLRW